MAFYAGGENRLLGDIAGVLGSSGHRRREICKGDRRWFALDLRGLAARQQLAAKMGAKIVFRKAAFKAERRTTWMGMDAGHEQLGRADGFCAAGAGKSASSGIC